MKFPCLRTVFGVKFREFSFSDTQTLENVARGKVHLNFTPNL